MNQQLLLDTSSASGLKVDDLVKDKLKPGLQHRRGWRLSQDGVRINVHLKTEEDVKLDFWERVDIKNEDQCWNWKRGATSGGRPMYRAFSRNIVSYRIAFLLHYGYLDKKLMVCHKCDNPMCNNPSHLFQGTALDNNRDAVAKGRNSVGEKNASAKLTEAQVIEIRNKYVPYYYKRERLAAEYGVAIPTIKSILSGRLWPHLLKT